MPPMYQCRMADFSCWFCDHQIERSDRGAVLMDMQMPVMDGLAATRALREIEQGDPGRRRTPIIMLSANAMSQHREEAADAGADQHLAKPITPGALMAAIERALPAALVADGV